MHKPKMMTLALTCVTALSVYKAIPLYHYASDILVSPAEASAPAGTDEVEPIEIASEEDVAVTSKPELDELILDVAVERQALQKWREELELKEAEIALAQSALDENARNLENLRSELEFLLERSQRENTEDVDRLVQIYNAMKPAQAATIMDDADIEVAVLVLAAMAPRDSGPILAVMNPVRARAISKIILERSRLPGDQKLVDLQLK
jgi:flagellar motility protein MotE (MotC chaperone)